MFEQQDLVRIANQTMPFGRFKGRALIDLPEEYLLWFVDRGFPAGQLGDLMQLTLEIKINGLEKLIYPLKMADDAAPRVRQSFTFGADEED
ncbi:MAG: DUF3820 family protein [Gammaproteobacteria bacterium]|jgi:uncharacterized protein (DUF3820 family)